MRAAHKLATTSPRVRLSDLVRHSPTLTPRDKGAFTAIMDAMLERRSYITTRYATKARREAVYDYEDWLDRMESEGYDRRTIEDLWDSNRAPVDMDTRRKKPFGYHQAMLDTGLRLWLLERARDAIPDDLKDVFSD